MSDFIKVASVSELAPGQGMVVEVADRTLALFNCNGEVFALDNTCPHRGGPLGEGYVDCRNMTVQCPWHGWTFGLATGISPVNARAKVEKFDVKIEDGEIKVSLE